MLRYRGAKVTTHWRTDGRNVSTTFGDVLEMAEYWYVHTFVH